jgi:hypothetical protein
MRVSVVATGMEDAASSLPEPRISLRSASARARRRSAPSPQRPRPAPARARSGRGDRAGSRAGPHARACPRRHRRAGARA